MSDLVISNGITEAEKQRAVFLSVIGPSTYKTLRNLVSPAKPGDKSYTELVELFSKHYKPTPSEIVERFKFHSRFRKAGESVATYVSELRCLSEFCNFGAALEDMLRDRLVCGINDAGIQKRLLAEPKVTYEKSVELSLAMERAAKNMKELSIKSEESSDVNTGPQEVHRLVSSSNCGNTKSVLMGCDQCQNSLFWKMVHISHIPTYFLKLGVCVLTC